MSSISIQRNSCEAQRQISSPSRDRCTPVIAAANRNSATKSRSATASIELGAAASKPSSAAVACGSSGSEDPASAPEPSGEIAARLSQSRSRSMSRVSGWTCASSWCENSTGWACWRWVMPGAATPRLCSACAISAVSSSTSRDTTWRAWSRRYRRRSVATWSLRLRPARSLPPSAPRRSSRPRSSAVCTSSSATVGRNSPDLHASSRSSRAPSMRSSSSAVSSPARLSTRACAREPSRSYGASRQSNWTLTESRASASDGPPSNRPPHRRVGALVTEILFFPPLCVRSIDRLGGAYRVSRGPRPPQRTGKGPGPSAYGHVGALRCVGARRPDGPVRAGQAFWPRSRMAAILLGRLHSSTKPLARLWSKVSPVS